MRFSLRKAAKVTLFVAAVFCFNLLFWKQYNISDSDISEDEPKHGGPVDPDARVADVARTRPGPPPLQERGAVRSQRSAMSVGQMNEHVKSVDRVTRDQQKFHQNVNKFQTSFKKTELDDVFISVKTTGAFHGPRLQLMLDTWINFAKSQTYIFSDVRDSKVERQLTEGHFINTNCSNSHNRRALCCKMSQEFDYFIDSKKRWFCHVDDDTYVNTPQLVALLQQYNHTQDWYLGKPSLNHPIEVLERGQQGPGILEIALTMIRRNQFKSKVSFWFATGGAGFCISLALALKMVPYAGGGKFMVTGDRIRLPDDCTIGYIIDNLLGKELTAIETFHSHLEALWKISEQEMHNQITFSYGGKENSLRLKGFSADQDPTRLRSLHCHLHPSLPQCLHRTR